MVEPSLGLGYTFTDDGLLTLALTHRSYCAEHPGTDSNERLEFLGDAVLGLAVTDVIYERYPDLPEGQLAKLRASVVNTTTLAELATGIGLGEGLRLGKGEELSGGRTKTSILADALEAVIGAVYLDGGWDAASRVVEALTDREIVEGSSRPGRADFKTRLQELAAELGRPAPTYDVRSSGPDHDRTFVAVAYVDGVAHGEGRGSSKKRAEQAAAETACGSLAAAPESDLTTNDPPEEPSDAPV